MADEWRTNRAARAQYASKDNYTVTIGDFLFVAMDSQGNGYMTLEEIAWADSLLKDNPDKIKILAYHHPLFSVEYEDDGGVITGGEFTASWRDDESWIDKVYFSWLDLPLWDTSRTRKASAHATDLMKTIDTNNVELVLSGYVHRDIIYIMNDKTRFITTTTIGGSLPEISYHGYRWIEVSNDGTITLDDVALSHLEENANSIELGGLLYYFKTLNDGSTSAVTVQIENHQERDITDLELEFKVSKTQDYESYTWMGTEPKSTTM